MPRILHTADWQIGKPYRWIENSQKQSRLQQERVDAVLRIAEVARQEQVDVVLVAGDLFDSSTVAAAMVMEVLEAVGSIPSPVVVIPGNHDHGGAGGIWRREDLRRQMQQRAGNLQLLLKPEPVVVAGITLLPCPLQRQRDSQSPSRWLDQLNWTDLDPVNPRVVLAHGSVQGFGGDGQVNQLCLDPLPRDQIDYIALGDWHALMEIDRRTWYSGTPEPDRFPTGTDDMRSQVLVIDVERAQPPMVRVKPTGRLHWHRITMTLNGDADLARLEQQLVEAVGSRVGRDLMRLELNGQLGLQGHLHLEDRLALLGQQLLHLRLRGKLHRQPTAQERDELLLRMDSPLVSTIAAGLQDELRSSADPLVEQALIELHRLCATDSSATDSCA
ncbi:MAG: serine/threonine protein phosphatase [Gammaproteobacteria bacterium]|nr:DNA repair exonuclease [Synechococcus sp. BIOS-U3-1]MAD08735.1 serine/threonine protein phosphatase [Gammaproteobacteria bacterium]QNI58587.1 calcineurin-like phosphoesterase family protein [Synechococcus sp. BIOS-U3-1]